MRNEVALSDTWLTDVTAIWLGLIWNLEDLRHVTETDGKRRVITLTKVNNTKWSIKEGRHFTHPRSPSFVTNMCSVTFLCGNFPLDHKHSLFYSTHDYEYRCFGTTTIDSATEQDKYTKWKNMLTKTCVWFRKQTLNYEIERTSYCRKSDTEGVNSSFFNRQSGYKYSPFNLAKKFSGFFW